MTAALRRVQQGGVIMSQRCPGEALVRRRGCGSTRLALLLSGGAVVALATSSASFAQVSAITPQGGDASQVSEVVVTAQKRSENIQNVPAAVSVVGSQLITDAHVTSLSDIQGYVPGLEINSAGSPGQTQVTIRGITVLGQNSVVGTYIGDSPIGGSSLYSRAQSFSLDLLPYDVSRLEVLRGPQGTLYGASTLGGLLKYVLKDPNLKSFEGEAGADLFGVSGAGDPGGGGRALVSAPIIQDKLGVLASYAYEGTPGYIDDVATGRGDDNPLSQQSARLALLWQPSNKLTVRTEALFQQIQSDNDAEIPVDATSRPSRILADLQSNNALDQPFRKEITFLSGDINYDLGWATLTSATSYSYSNTKKQTDYSSLFGTLFPAFGAAAPGLAPIDYKLQTIKYTEEIRLASPKGSRVEWLIGTFDTYERSTNSQVITPSTFSGQPIPSITPFFIGGFTPSLYREYAIFGDVTFHLTDRLDIGGGLRYADNVQGFRAPSAGLLNGVPIDAQAIVNTGHSSEDVLTYSFNPQYRFTKDVMAYVRIASGYAPGGPNTFLAGVPPTVGSETITSYEVGVKSEFLNKRLLFDADYFYIDFSNLQLPATSSGGIGYLFNGGAARSEGVEANATLRPLTGLSLSGTFTYTDSVLAADVPEIGGSSGERLPEVPRYSGSFRADYSRPLSAEWTGHAGGGVRVVGAEADGLFSDLVRLPAYAVLDLDLSASNSRYTIRVFAKNLNDSRGFTSYQPYGAPYAFIQQPRTIGVSVDAKF